MNLIASSFGDGDILLFMLEFFLFIIWFWLLVTIFSDLFRDHDLSGGLKALWVVFLIVLPFLGILIYLIARGRGMAERQAKYAARMREAMDAQIRSAAGTSSSAADQISQAKTLLDNGAISQAEFETLKAKALDLR